MSWAWWVPWASRRERQKNLQAQLLKAQINEKQLNGLVLSQTYRSTNDEQYVQLLAQQVVALKTEVQEAKTEVQEASIKLAGEHSKAQSLDTQLMQARTELQEMQAQVERKTSQWEQAETRAQAAEAREVNALKAGELEEMALNQQEELLKKMKRNQDATRGNQQPYPSY